MPVKPLGLLLAALTLAACDANQLYIAHDTVLGLNANVNSARTSGKLVFGYDRQFGTLIPKSVSVEEDQNGSSKGREAMAVLACSDVGVDGIFLTRFVEHLATGQAARNFAKELADSPDNVNLGFFQCFDAGTPEDSDTGDSSAPEASDTSDTNASETNDASASDTSGSE